MLVLQEPAFPQRNVLKANGSNGQATLADQPDVVFWDRVLLFGLFRLVLATGTLRCGKDRKELLNVMLPRLL